MRAAEAVEPTLTVDLDALAHNLRVVAAAAGGAEVAPVVKADGYGLGAGPVARALWAAGSRAFFVARPSEGRALREALGPGQAGVIYVLDGCAAGSAARLDEAALTPVLNSLSQVEAWAAHARTCGRRLPAALHVDTGMNRLGLRVEEAAALATSDRLRGLDLRLVISHLACADTPGHALNAVQAERFAAARALFPDVRASLANSAGVFLGEAYRFDLVRPGIALYGGGPCGRPDPRLRPVATLTTPVLQVRTVPRGESVGYGANFVAERPTRVAVLAAGYADGVLRSGSRLGCGWIRGSARPVLGRISMDTIALDVTDVGGEGDVLAGDRVELLGGHVPLDEVAACAGTISYELLVRLGIRIPRNYVGTAFDRLIGHDLT